MDEKRTTNRERLQEITAGIEQGIKELDRKKHTSEL